MGIQRDDNRCSLEAQYDSRLSSRLVPHGHRSRAELEPADQPQVERLREPCEQSRPVSRQPGLHYELVLIDQSHLPQRLRELPAPDEQSLTRLLLELLNGLLQIS